RNGFGSAVMQAAQDALDRDGNAEFGLLFCEPKNAAFYEKLGWNVFRGTVLADQPNGTIRYDALDAMVFPFASSSPQSGFLDLRGPPW
ncbi:MAG: GNAT family N-acetyltransferase, partial [Pseudomonadota bacterium]